MNCSTAVSEERERERERERENPAVIIQSEVQNVLPGPGSSATLEARVFASTSESAVVQWYHRRRLIDDATESSYTATSAGDSYRQTVRPCQVNFLFLGFGGSVFG